MDCNLSDQLNVQFFISGNNNEITENSVVYSLVASFRQFSVEFVMYRQDLGKKEFALI